MRMSTEHERLVRMIKESITLMCKSSLTYELELNVEGLLGITLDKKDIVLVNINESFQTEAHKQLEEEKEQRKRQATDDQKDVVEIKEEERPGSARKRRRRSRGSPAPQQSEQVVADYELPEFSASRGSRTDDLGDSGSSQFSPSKYSHVSAARGRLDSAEGSADALGGMDTRSSDGTGKGGDSGLDFGSFVIKQEVGDTSDNDDFSFTGESFEGQSPYPGGMPSDGGGMDPSQVPPGFPAAGTSTGGPDGSQAGFDMSAGITRPPEQSRQSPEHLGTMHTCKYCGRKFALGIGMQRHQRIHTGGGFSCGTCGHIFRDKFALERHTNGVHLQNRSKFVCERCQKTFTRMDNLKAHQKYTCVG